ncbi:MAG: SpoIIIAH-like family protein [Eubacterium sp.]
MRKIFKKNQVIVTLLAVLIAVAGYLNYADKNEKAKEVNNDTYDAVYSNDDLVSGTGDIESLDGEEKETVQDTTEEPGAAVLTNGTSLSSFMVQARLDREQTRSKNKETLMEVINNEAVNDSEKKKAVKSMTQITDRCETENNIETLLKAKGFSDVVVTLSEDQADVIISSKEVDDSKRAQIEDVIKRKTGFTADNITITPTSDN